jgi:hypothetical protein
MPRLNSLQIKRSPVIPSIVRKANLPRLVNKYKKKWSKTTMIMMKMKRSKMMKKVKRMKSMGKIMK